MKQTNYAPNFKIYRSLHAALFIMALVFSFASCKKNNTPPATVTVSSKMLLMWNDAATVAVTRAGLGPNGPLPPMPESYIYAQVNVAMHDALNGVYSKYTTYALKTVDKTADPDAAVAKAAHDIIVALLPPDAAYADSMYQASIGGIPESSAKTNGITLGQEAAAAMIAKRANDGYTTAQIPFTQGTMPGQYRFTAPFDGPPFNGFAAVPAWGNITPFGVASSSQFRPVAPYAVNTPEYAADYNEIKGMGASVNSTRTADQTQIGLFWLENSPLGWNRIARNLIQQKGMDAVEAAHVLGILHMALADANISSLEAKYYYKYWRPITAVQMGDSDGNSSTTGDASFSILAPPTPPIPDYPSNHAVNGGAASQVLTDFFGSNVSFTANSSSLASVTRSFSSFKAAANENALSRIYVGFHFRNAVEKGEAQGLLIGDYVYKNSLPKL